MLLSFASKLKGRQETKAALLKTGQNSTTLLLYYSSKDSKRVHEPNAARRTHFNIMHQSLKRFVPVWKLGLSELVSPVWEIRHSERK
jgi:hypothetical protein